MRTQYALYEMAAYCIAIVEVNIDIWRFEVLKTNIQLTLPLRAFRS